MKRLILALCLASPSALAQQPAPDPAQTALSQEIMECVGGKVQLRARINQLEAELAKLTDAGTKPPAPPSPTNAAP